MSTESESPICADCKTPLSHDHDGYWCEACQCRAADQYNAIQKERDEALAASVAMGEINDESKKLNACLRAQLEHWKNEHDRIGASLDVALNRWKDEAEMATHSMRKTEQRCEALLKIGIDDSRIVEIYHAKGLLIEDAISLIRERDAALARVEESSEALEKQITYTGIVCDRLADKSAVLIAANKRAEEVAAQTEDKLHINWQCLKSIEADRDAALARADEEKRQLDLSATALTDARAMLAQAEARCRELEDIIKHEIAWMAEEGELLRDEHARDLLRRRSTALAARANAGDKP